MNESTTLREFLETSYKPQHLADATYHVYDRFPRAINWLARMLGRVPLLSDLTFDTVKQLQAYLERQGKSPYTIRTIGRRLGDIWRHAATLNMAPPCRSVPYVTGKLRQSKAEKSPAAPAGTLERHYMTKLRPSMASKGTTYVEYFDVVISRFTMFRGTFTSLPEINEDLIESFGDWLQAIGQTPKTAENYVGGLRRIVRMIDAELCRPPATAWHKRKQGPAPVGSIRHFYVTAYVPLKMIDAKRGSLINLESTIAKLNEFAGHEVMVAELSDELLAGLMRWTLERGACATTANNRRACLSAIWRFAKRRGLIATLPDVPKLKECRPEPDAWSLEELGRIINACDEQRGRIGNMPKRAFFKALTYLGYYTALRRSSMLNLRCSDFTLKAKLLEVRPETMKNRRGKKFIMPADLLSAVRAIWSSDRDLLLPVPWTNPKPLYRVWDAILRQAGLPTGRRQKFHKLRRTSATAAACKVGIIGAMGLLGHSEHYITERYVDPTKLPGMNVTALLDPPIINAN